MMMESKLKHDLLKLALVLLPFVLGLIVTLVFKTKEDQHLIKKRFLIFSILLIIEFGLALSIIIIPPPKSVLKQNGKIFGIGLSRTGTTSLTLALESELNFKSYHALHKLIDFHDNHESMQYRAPWVIGDSNNNNKIKPQLVDYYINGFDAFTDINHVIFIEELLVKYPDAKFIFNQRDDTKWANAMLKFMKENEMLWHLTEYLHFNTNRLIPPIPVHTLYQVVYGTDYLSYELQDWITISKNYKQYIQKIFKNHKNRLLEIDVTINKPKETWVKLLNFLELEKDTINSEITPFIKADVWRFTFTTQPRYQVRNLLLYLFH